MTSWTTGDLKTLHHIVSNAGNDTSNAFKKASSKLKKSTSSCRRKWARTNWNKIVGEECGIKIEDPDRRPWDHLEMLQLYDLRDNKKLDYKTIAGMLRRSATSCERCFQRIKKAGTYSIAGKNSVKQELSSIIADEQRQKLNQEQESKKTKTIEIHAGLTEKLVDWLVSTVKSEPENLRAMDEETFNAKLERMLANPDSKVKREDVTVGFEDIRKLAMSRIDAIGMTYPKTRNLAKGRYMVVGDSHGKQTSLGTFKLLQRLNEELECDAVIHLGHISDDNDEISYEWQKFKNLIVVGMLSELHLLKKQVYKYDVVRDNIVLGNAFIENQYDAGDYVKKGVGRIDPMTIPDFSIVNCHRHEMHSHCGYKRERIVASPGCVCRRHPNQTVKQLIFKNGLPHVRQTHPHGFRKYNKQEQDSARWENGIIIIEVDGEGKATPIMARIFDTKLGKTTAYAGVIYGEDQTCLPESKMFFNADFHCNFHDPKVLDMQEQFCSDYVPDIHINLGDVIDNRALSHHLGGLNGPAFYHDGDRFVYRNSMVEVASSRYVMKRMRKWAPKSYLIVGNHERFSSDLAAKMPQLQDLMTTEVLLDTERMDINVTQLKHTLDFGYVKFIHGDIKVWGGTGGSKVDKVANNYGQNTVMGNIHYPAIRSGCYSVPMTGLLDQKYNEVEASQWMQGFGYADVFDGQCFVSIIPIMGGHFTIRGKKYAPRDCSSWAVPSYKIRINIDFDGKPNESPTKASGFPMKALNTSGSVKITGQRIKARPS